jgi:hypothetical protein
VAERKRQRAKRLGMTDYELNPEDLPAYDPHFMPIPPKQTEKRQEPAPAATPTVGVKDMADYVPRETFTNSTRFTYIESFLMGLNLQRNFPSSDKCQNNIFYTMDEWTEFRNNWTLTFTFTEPDDIRPLLPVMALLETVGGNFSAAFPNCYETSEEIVDYFRSIVEVFSYGDGDDRSMSIFQLVRYYMLTQFTYAIQYKNAFERLEENEET